MSEARRALINLRSQLDELDAELFQILFRRFNHVHKISDVKIKLGMQIVDLERENYILNRVEKMAEAEGLNKKYIHDIFQTIIDCSSKFEEYLRRSAKQ